MHKAKLSSKKNSPVIDIQSKASSTLIAPHIKDILRVLGEDPEPDQRLFSERETDRERCVV
jgi:hypothetical protein